MTILPIESSSSGNSVYIFTDNTHILIDAGVSVKKIIEKSKRDKFDALFITHEHSDHTSSAGPVGRKLKVPIYINKLSYEVIKNKLENVKINFMNPGEEIIISDLKIKNFSTKHDAKYSCGFFISDLSKKVNLCYITDTGIITPLMSYFIKKADALFIEADYDVEKLKENIKYSPMLKHRIANIQGHLSNDDVIRELKNFEIKNLKYIIFGHLSKENNSPELIIKTAKDNFPNYKGVFKVAPFKEYLKI